MGRIACDKKLCCGCLACVVACIDEHYDETRADAVSGRIYAKETSDRTELQCYKTRSCLHCANAACVDICPTEALYYENGFVRTDRDKCIGCRACEGACPFDVPRFDGDGKIVKCDGCADRVAAGLEPACVRICPLKALKMV